MLLFLVTLHAIWNRNGGYCVTVSKSANGSIVYDVKIPASTFTNFKPDAENATAVPRSTDSVASKSRFFDISIFLTSLNY